MFSITFQSYKMAVARTQIRGFYKRLFSSISITHPPPHRPQITDDREKFSFLDAVEGSPWPQTPVNLCHVFIKRSCLKGATEEEKMDFHVKTAAQVLGSEEEAKERIYKITRDCSLDGFALDICYDGASKIHDLQSVDKIDLEPAGTVHFYGDELIRWSLLPKRREKGRFPVPKPALDIDNDSDGCGGSESDYD